MGTGVRFTMPIMVLPLGGDVVIIGQKALREKLGISVMAQPNASGRITRGRQYAAGVEFTARDVGEPKAGAVLRAAMAVRTFWLGGDAPGCVDHTVYTCAAIPTTHDTSRPRSRDAE